MVLCGMQMTHDELLFKIYEIHNDSSEAGQETNKQYKGMIKFMQALRAVVELHKPEQITATFSVCSNCYDEENGPSDYPCTTIQAIEIELS